tara:strand:+ start:1568 stop:1834 length:267 start_codon:yes stop_codon:yes gene_type:complete
MNIFKISLCVCFLLCACTSKELTPYDAAQQACECMKLSKDSSEEGVQAFKDCNTKTTEMIAKHKEDTQWMTEWREELMAILKDCMSTE